MFNRLRDVYLIPQKVSRSSLNFVTGNCPSSKDPDRCVSPPYVPIHQRTSDR